MSYLGNSPVLSKRQLFKFIATAGQTDFSGTDANSLTLNYTPGLEDVFVNGLYVAPSNYTANDGSIISFSSGLSAGTEVSISAAGAFNPADTLAASQNGADIVSKTLFRQSIQSALPSGVVGHIINPAFEFSQERGTTALNVSTNGSPYVIDQWLCGRNASAIFNIQQISGNLSAVPTFRHFSYGLRTTITTPQASFTAGEYISPTYQLLEGFFTSGLCFGTSDARAIDVALIITASVAGTYALAFQNASNTRSYVTTFTLAANTPTMIFKTIPGDTSGTWPTGTVSSSGLLIGGITGSTYQAPSLNTWNTGNYFSHSSCTNWAATTNATLTINFCNFYQSGVLPYSETNNSGLLPLLNRLRLVSDLEILRCQRYFEAGEQPVFYLSSAAAAGYYDSVQFRTQKRVAPTVTTANWQVWIGPTGSTSAPTIYSTSSNKFAFQYTGSNITGSTGTGTWIASARL